MTHASNTTTSSTLAFLAGMGAGVAAGLLFAPRGGEETRNQIKEKIRDARSKAMQTAHEQKDMMKDKLTQAKESSQDMIEEGKKNAEQKQNQLRRSQNSPAP